MPAEKEGRIPPREEEIRAFIRDNPGCNKQQVARYMNSDKTPVQASYVTTMRGINNLVKWKIVKEVPDEKNRQTKRLYLADDSLYNHIIDEVKSFRRSYFKLLNNASDRLLAQGPVLAGSPQAREAMRLFANIFDMYYAAIDSINYRARAVWPELVRDKEELKKLYAAVFSELADMQLTLIANVGRFSRVNYLKFYFDDVKKRELLWKVPELTKESELWKKYGVETEAGEAIRSISKLHLDKEIAAAAAIIPEAPTPTQTRPLADEELARRAGIVTIEAEEFRELPGQDNAGVKTESVSVPRDELLAIMKEDPEEKGEFFRSTVHSANTPTGKKIQGLFEKYKGKKRPGKKGLG